MAILAIFEQPGMTQAAYEKIVRQVAGGRRVLSQPADVPVPGLITHASAPTEDGWIIVDVWESEEALMRFLEVIKPLLREVGALQWEPRIYQVFNLVNP